MYHDAFTLLAGAVDRTFAEINEGGKKTPEALSIPTKDDVYNTLIIPSIAGDGCSSCLVGAGGTYGFEGPGKNDQWAVCKPVPVVEFPSSARSGDPGAPGLYRTYRNGSGNACPS
ncbi:hypothetical protein SVIO_089860 [Streptomyces violaceusniger]|uniref:Uncharacterized protein n=2 Tax=Streptomyces violaceusniger TaxID=68280 RepID=A0A4D4LJX6_STRVO|nr:hypothetical protein SVIO_089860 [Streptomyces violaceusniger]